MFKKVLLSVILASILNAEYFNANEVKEVQAFSEGFQLAITGTKLKEFKIQGYKKEEIKFDEYIVVVDSTGLDDAKKFLIQQIGFRTFDSVRLTNEWIVLGSFKEKPNAELLRDTINQKWFNVLDKSRQAFVHQNTTNIAYTKSKSLYSDIAEVIEEDISKNKKILLVEKVTPVAPIDIVEKQPTKPMKIETIPEEPMLNRKKPSSPSELFDKTNVKEKSKGNEVVIPKKQNQTIKKIDEVELPVIQPVIQKNTEIEKKKEELAHPVVYELLLKDSSALVYSNNSGKTQNVPLASIREIGNYENSGTLYFSDKKITDAKGKVYYKIVNKETLLREDDVIVAKESKL